MADESYSFSTARARLEEIVSQVRKKDTSLEKSLDLLEEGVRLANACTELIDHQDWAAGTTPPADAVAQGEPTASSPAEPEVSDSEAEETIVVEDVAVIEDVVVTDADGEFVAEIIEVTEYESAVQFADADDAWADDSETVPAEELEDPSASEG